MGWVPKWAKPRRRGFAHFWPFVLGSPKKFLTQNLTPHSAVPRPPVFKTHSLIQFPDQANAGACQPAAPPPPSPAVGSRTHISAPALSSRRDWDQWCASLGVGGAPSPAQSSRGGRPPLPPCAPPLFPQMFYPVALGSDCPSHRAASCQAECVFFLCGVVNGCGVGAPENMNSYSQVQENHLLPSFDNTIFFGILKTKN